MPRDIRQFSEVLNAAREGTMVDPVVLFNAGLVDADVLQLVPFIKRNPRITKVFLTNNQITDIGANALAGCSHLRILNLSGNRISPAGIKHLAAHRSLQKLYVSGNSRLDWVKDALAPLLGHPALFFVDHGTMTWSSDDERHAFLGMLRANLFMHDLKKFNDSAGDIVELMIHESLLNRLNAALIERAIARKRFVPEIYLVCEAGKCSIKSLYGFKDLYLKKGSCFAHLESKWRLIEQIHKALLRQAALAVPPKPFVPSVCDIGLHAPHRSASAPRQANRPSFAGVVPKAGM